MKGDIKGRENTLDELKRVRRRNAELELLEKRHKKIEKELRESEEKYRTRIENISLGVYRNTGGPNGRFLQANPAMAKMFGYNSVKEFMKVRVSKLYQNPKERKLFVEEVLLSGSLKDKELLLKKKDGTPIVCSATSKVQFDKDGGIKWIDGVIEDITDRKRSEERIIKSSYFEHTISSVLKKASPAYLL
jgi:PAS domain S-box-containing protein